METTTTSNSVIPPIHDATVCPHCGHCPTCGRRRDTGIWIQPQITWSTPPIYNVN